MRDKLGMAAAAALSSFRAVTMTGGVLGIANQSRHHATAMAKTTSAIAMNAALI
jgi:hypothetical protein